MGPLAQQTQTSLDMDPLSQDMSTPSPRRAMLSSRHRQTGPVPIILETSPTPPTLSATVLPPNYHLSSPPKYAPLPASAETALLLGPPPSFYASTPCSTCNLEVTCGAPCRCQEARQAWIVKSLILATFAVWTLVIGAYWRAWMSMDWDVMGCGEYGPGGGIVGGYPGCRYPHHAGSQDPATANRMIESWFMTDP